MKKNQTKKQNQKKKLSKSEKKQRDLLSKSEYQPDMWPGFIDD